MNTSTAKYSACVDPLVIRRQEISLSTGEISQSVFEKRCGTRRKDKCEPCSTIWRDDAYFALLNPSKEHSGSITFITLTAPGSKLFGKTHRGSYLGKASERCPCRKYHHPNDSIVGLPLKPRSFNYALVSDFNHKASRLTTVTLQKIQRLMLSEMNRNKPADLKKDMKDIRLPVARVMEWQDRGVLHVHIIVRGHIPTYIVDRAVNGSAKTESRRRINPASHQGQSWGKVIDVQHINSADTNQIKKLSSYVTKVVNYALKDVTGDGQAKSSEKESFNKAIRRTTNWVVPCKRSASECDASPMLTSTQIIGKPTRKSNNYCVKHRRAHHQLGFTGNVLTLNKQWGSTLGLARKTRIAFAASFVRQVRNADKAVRLDKEKKLVTHVVHKRRKMPNSTFLAFSNSLQTVDTKEIFISLKT